MGGRNINYSNVTRKYKLETDPWDLMSPIKNSRCYFGSLLDKYQKKIYVFGGFNSTKSLNDIECYNITDNNWAFINLFLP